MHVVEVGSETCPTLLVRADMTVSDDVDPGDS